MKNILAALVLAMTGFATAEASDRSDFSYTFFGNTSSGYTMVSCDYAQELIQKWMEKFGAKDIDVQCTGGIQATGIYPLGLEVTYTAPSTKPPTLTTDIMIESDPFPGGSDCDFDTSLMSALLRDFRNVTVSHRSYACFGPNSTYTYNLAITVSK